ncbi:hypothetical protein TCE0_004r00238 [Talaromyces pinophilus]|uniref:N-acetyltransferase domain-containing protein n=1 Tax=Talaromyces pinophilus TaxID=128442 RepID=A0A0B8MXS9_TALPI|nr:hypothetical protein TCE0_004r00238 [Talaromyces pinophilus]
MPIQILPLQQKDIPGVVECIQEGFADDPYHLWVFDGSKEVADHQDDGVDGDGRVIGVSCWLAPQPAAPKNQSTAQSWYAWYQLQLLSVRQLLTNIRFLGRGGLITKRYWIWKEQQTAAQREIWTDTEKGYYFCNMVTVRPEAQGRGIGRRLFEVVMDKADREGVKCYLESSKGEPNVRIYEKMGFGLVKEIDCVDGGDVCRGGNDTFLKFPDQLTALVRHALPNISVQYVTYPKFETRGDLKDCVGRFREWLQNKVIDIEVSNSTPSPTIDPSVHVILIGHSMGGIVGAETLLLLASEQPIPPLTASQMRDSSESIPFFMFPHIQGLMAFDTPFLGIAPGVVSHGAQEHYRTASTAYNTFNEVAGIFGYGGNKAASTAGTATTAATTTTGTTAAGSAAAKSAVLPLPPATTDAAADAAATPSWSRWGKMAMFAGAAGAVAAGGAAALYSQRERFNEGWRWVTSHLEFVGCLARPGDLRNRVASLAEIQRERGIKAINFYTCLGQGAAPRAVDPSAASNNAARSQSSSLFLRIPRAKDRTFCHLPEDFDASDHLLAGDGTPDHPGLKWVLALNDKVGDETTAHISMFGPKENPKYYMLAHEAADTIVRWIDQGWYASSTSEQPEEEGVREPDEGDGGGGKGKDDKDDFIVI